MTLAEFLAAKNAQTLAWIAEDPDNRWAGLLTEDLTHWAEMGVHTVEDFKRYDLISLIWDMYKDVTGIRPRHMDFESMSMEDLEKEANWLGSQIEASIRADEDWLAQEEAWEAEREAEEAAARAELPEPIDYVAANYQEGWL